MYAINSLENDVVIYTHRLLVHDMDVVSHEYRGVNN